MVSGFSISMPTGWRQFLVDDEGRAALTAQASRRFKDLGRPDLDVQVRMMVSEQWRKLQSARITAIYLPGPDERQTVLPVSIAVRQHQAPAGVGFEQSVRGMVGSAPVEVFQAPFGTVFRWMSGSTGSGELAEVRSTQIGYAMPLPGEEGERRGMLFFASIASLEDTDPQMLELLSEGVDTIMETFRWK